MKIAKNLEKIIKFLETSMTEERPGFEPGSSVPQSSVLPLDCESEMNIAIAIVPFVLLIRGVHVAPSMH